MNSVNIIAYAAEYTQNHEVKNVKPIENETGYPKVTPYPDEPQPEWVKSLKEAARSRPSDKTDNSRLVRESKKIEKIIRSRRFKVKFYSECTTELSPVAHINCELFFPTVSGNMRYLHEIEAFTLDLARSFASKGSVSFAIYAMMKDRGDKEAAIRVKQSQVQGDFIPVCAYAYWKEFDKLESIWPSL